MHLNTQKGCEHIMAIDFKTLIGVAFDIKQAQSELDRQIKSLQKNSKLALEIELSDKDAKKAIQDQSKAWSNYRKEAVAAITAPNTELQKMGQYYKNQEKEIQKNINLKKKMYLDESNAYKINESINQKRIANQSKLNRAELEAYKTNDKLNDSMYITKNRADGASQSFQAYIKTLKPQALKQYTGEINKISNAFSEASTSGNKMDLSKANSHLSKFKSEMKNAGMETASFSQILKDNISAFSQWYFIGNAVSSVVRNFRAAIGTIVEVDTLLSEISKTSDLTGESLKELGINAFDAASKYGNTVQSYLEGYKEMSRGTDKATAQGLAEMSILAQSAGDMTAELANEYIIATNAAYKLNGEVSKINAVLDSQNQVSNRNQISMSKIAEATKIAGSQSATSGVAINEMTAAISTMGVVTQAEGERLGRSWKGILMNIQQVKGETEDGEIIDSEALSKSEKAASDLGVSFKEVRNGILSLRDPMVVIKELSEAYSKLAEGDVRGTNLVSAIGGKYRANELSALLSNYEMYTKILGDYENANGSALSEAQKTADSIEGRLNKMTNTWNEAVANVVSSDMLKTFVSIGTGAIELADDINLLQNALIALGGLGAYKGLTSFVPMLQNAISSTIAFGNALNTVKGSDFVVNSTNLSSALSGLSSKQMVTVLSTKALSTELKSMSVSQLTATLTNAGLSEAEAKTTASTLLMASATGTATTSTLGLGASIKALGAAMMANPIGLIITGITIAISALSFGLSKAKQAQEEYIQTTKQHAEESKSLTSNISDLVNKYNELSKEVKTNASVKDDLITTQNELLTKLGLEGQSVEDLTKKYGGLTEAIRQATLSQLQDSERSLKAQYSNEKESLLDTGGYKWTDNEQSSLVFSSKKNYDALTTLLKDAGLNISDGKNKNTGYLNFDGDEKTTKGILENFKDIKTAMDTISNSGLYKTDQLQNLDLYTKLQDRYTELKPAVDSYNSSITDLNINLAQQQTLFSLQGQEVPKTQKEFELFKQSLVDNAIASGKFIGSQDQIKASIENFLATQPEFVGFFDTVTTSASRASESISNIFSDETASKAIDSFQSSMKTIQSALKDTSSLSSSDIIDLMQEFSDFDWKAYGITGATGVGDLTGAFKALATEQYNTIISTTGESDALKVLYEETLNSVNGVLSLTDAMSTLSKTGKSLENLKSEIKELGYISTDTLDGLLGKSDSLDTVIAEYNAGLASTEDVLAELTNSYNTDFENYKHSVINKISQSENFYTDFTKNLPDWVQNLANAYDVDFNNFKTVQEAKLALSKELATKQALLKPFEDEKFMSSLAFGDKQSAESIQNWLNNGVKDIQSIISGVDITLGNNLNLNRYTPSGSDKTKTKKVELPEKYVSKRADLEHRKAMGLSDEEYYKELTGLEEDYLKGHKEYQSEIWSIDEAKHKHNQDLADKAKDDAKDAIKSKFDDNEHAYAMGEKTEEEYYKTLKWLNWKYYKNDEDNQDKYLSNREKLYAYDQKLLEKDNDAKLKDTDDYISTVVDRYKKSLSDIDKVASSSEDGSDAQLQAYSNGLKTAGDQVKFLESQVKKLNEQYKDKSDEDYINQLENLTSKIDDAKESMLSYQESITDGIKAQLKKQTDALEDAYKEQEKAIEDRYDKELDMLNEIVDAKKKALQADKDAAKYAKDLAEKTKALSDIDTRMADLSKAANSGDREAQAELKKLQEDRSKAQEALDELQADHKLDTELDALDKFADSYEKQSKINKQLDLDSAKSVHEQKLADVTALYQKEQELIKNVADYTKAQFATAIQDINSQLTNLGIDNSTSSNALTNSYDQLKNNSNSIASSAKNSAVLSLLSNGTSKTGNSELNKYVKSNYGSYLTFDEMVRLAQMLGLSNIDGVDDVKGNSANRMAILNKLKSARYAKGGIGEVVGSLGEHGIGLFRNKEALLSEFDSKNFKDFVPIMNDITKFIKLNIPDTSKLITKTTSPNISITIPIAGNADSSTVSSLNNASNNIIKQIMNEVRKL